MIMSMAKYSMENKQSHFRAILLAQGNATWTLTVITTYQVSGKVLDGEQNLNFRAILDAYSNAAWTLVVLTNDQVHGRVLDGGQTIEFQIHLPCT